jgi:hypothetical protein
VERRRSIGDGLVRADFFRIAFIVIAVYISTAVKVVLTFW